MDKFLKRISIHFSNLVTEESFDSCIEFLSIDRVVLDDLVARCRYLYLREETSREEKKRESRFGLRWNSSNAVEVRFRSLRREQPLLPKPFSRFLPVVTESNKTSLGKFLRRDVTRKKEETLWFFAPIVHPSTFPTTLLLINKVYRFIYNTISSKIFKIPNQFETLYPFVNSTREGLYLTAEHMFVLNVALPYHHRYSSINRKQLFHSFRKWRLGYAKVRKGEPAT